MAEPSSPELISSQSLASELEYHFDRSSEKGYYRFLNYLRANVTPDQLVADRVAQSNLDDYTSCHMTGDPEYPYPALEYSYASGGGFTHQPFLLKDDPNFIYWISEGYPSDTAAVEFLRPEDMISYKDRGFPKFPKVRTQIHGEKFTKSFQRVSIRGGKSMRYNYVKQDWEYEENSGIYKKVDPDSLQKAVKKLERSQATSIGDYLSNEIQAIRHRLSGPK